MAEEKTIHDLGTVDVVGTAENSSGGTSGGAESVIGKIWSFLTKADEWFTGVNMYEVLHSDRAKSLIKLEQLNFLPLYVRKHIANDFYTKMFSQLYPDPHTAGTGSTSSGGILSKISNSISNAAGAAVSKVTNTVANQITATANYARNLVSTLTFGLVDTSKSVTSGAKCSYQMIQTSIPHLKVTEIRLNDKLSQKGILFSCMAKLFKAGASLGNSDQGMDKITEKVTKGFESGLDAICQETLHMTASEWLDSMSSTELTDVLSTRIGGLAYSFIRNGASGQYMNTYELPHFGTPTMLKSVATGGFDHASGSGDVLKIINDMTGENATLMENISWSAEKAKGSFTMGPFEGTFYLFNDTLQMYRDNLDFILRVVTHSMPIRDSFMYRAPCCYDVTDVGNRRCYFCSGEFSVKKVGKIRKLSSSPSLKFGMWDGLAEQIKKGIMDGSDGLYATDINDDIVDYIPDAFEITYTFQPLISENYNTFVYYFLKENYVTNCPPVVDYGRNIDYLSDALMKKFVDAFTKELA